MNNTKPANKLNVSRVLRAAGYRPKNNERMHSTGGYISSQEGPRVLVRHRFGPEADMMPDAEREDLRGAYNDAYATVLAEAGYPLADREPGDPVRVTGGK
ncbi:hypothetical protein AB0P37_08385 [Streptomyces antimycoticus]|uniref:hypothetical protein n=1 Tax=Streptomyces antimycoticus TaxID=68175 RepID=UPI0034346A09